MPAPGSRRHAAGAARNRFSSFIRARQWHLLQPAVRAGGTPAKAPVSWATFKIFAARQMELLTTFIDIILHLDVHLAALTAQYGTWIYVILFLIIFCETGLVIFPFPAGGFAAVRGRRAGCHRRHGHLGVVRRAADRGGAGRQHQLLDRPHHRAKGVSLGKLPASSTAPPSTRPTPTSNPTAARPSSSPASCPCCAPSPPSWPAWRA